MSKLYFTKYLPVEGEIKEGDLVMNAAAGADHKWEASYDHKNYAPTTKLAKLFLCSRDIQVGDKIIHPMTGEEVGVLEIINGWIKYGTHPNEIANTGLFKKTGEISPHATWVTEGMEFDGDELNIIEHIVAERCGNNATNEFYRNYMLPKEWINDHSDWWTDGTVIPGKTIVEIKGPCGHFH